MTLVENDIIFCCYCGEKILDKKLFSKEHLIPASWGGNSSTYNLRPCCKTCNSERGSTPLVIWLGRLKLKLRDLPKSSRLAYRIEAQIENVQYWIHYIESAGEKLYYTTEQFQKRNFNYCFPI